MTKGIFIFFLFIWLGHIGLYEADAKSRQPHPLLLPDTLTVDDCSRCIILAEQSKPAIRIIDVDRNKEIWRWNPYQAENLQQLEWFSHPDEAKPVYDKQFLLVTASGGGVALIRIANKKVLFQAMAGGNPHSAELLPDGNIVTASSTGNYLRIFRVDTLRSPDDVYSKKIPIPSGHNVVWDKKRDLLWSAGGNMLYAYEYNFDCSTPDLALVDSLQLPGDGTHDLFPVFGRDALWLTNTHAVYTYNLANGKIQPVDTPYQKHIKSISSGPEGYPTVIIQPKKSGRRMK